MALLAQEGPGNWLMYFGQNKLSERWSIHTEVQHRNYELSPATLEQLLMRSGVNYHHRSGVMYTAGYARIHNHVFESEQSAPELTEDRIFQQVIMSHWNGRVKSEHRYRFEQRWVADEFRMRFRYRLMVFIPINTERIEPGTWFAGIYDEVFINSESTFFDRNRLYGALGYQLNSVTQLQIGALHQQVGDFGKWHAQFAVVFNPWLTNQDKE